MLYFLRICAGSCRRFFLSCRGKLDVDSPLNRPMPARRAPLDFAWDELRRRPGNASGRRTVARDKGSRHYSIAVAGLLREDRPGQPVDAGCRAELGLGRSRTPGRSLQVARRIAEGGVGCVAAAAPAGQPSTDGTAAPHAGRRRRDPRSIRALAEATRAVDLRAAFAPLTT